MKSVLASLVVSCAIFGVLLVTPHQAAAQQKTVFVDSDKLLQEMPDAKTVDAQLANLKKFGEDSLNTIKNAFTQRSDQYNKQKALMSAEAAKQEEAILLALSDRYTKFQQEFFGQNGQYFQMRAQILAPLLKKVQEVIAKVARQEKATVVMDTKSVLYYDPKSDLTFKVLDALKRGDN